MTDLPKFTAEMRQAELDRLRAPELDVSETEMFAFARAAGLTSYETVPLYRALKAFRNGRTVPTGLPANE